MRRYFIRFSYIGTRYRATQKQIHGRNIRDSDSVQGAIESAFLSVIPKQNQEPSLYLSSRTDRGVHALSSTAHVDIDCEYDQIYTTELIKYINRYFVRCGHSIRLMDLVPVTFDFHAQHSARGRTYMYRFMTPKTETINRPIIEIDYTYYLRNHQFDAEKVKSATSLFMGLKNFQTFSSETNSNKKIEYVRQLDSLFLRSGQTLAPFDSSSTNFDYWEIICSARSFLYNQVRRIVGSLIAVGVGKLSEKDITVMLQVPSHSNWNPRAQTVPSMGLYLMDVKYDLEEFEKCVIKLNESEVKAI